MYLNQEVPMLNKEDFAVIKALNQHGVYLKDIDDEVNKMGLNPINPLFTRWTFKKALVKAAHSKDELKTYIAQTQLGNTKIIESQLGFEVRLEK